MCPDRITDRRYLGSDYAESNPAWDIEDSLDVIEHVSNPFEFLAELRGRADRYIFHIPLDLSAVTVLRETPLLHVRKKVWHIHYFTKTLALMLLNERGYQVLDWFCTGWSWPQRPICHKACHMRAEQTSRRLNISIATASPCACMHIQ